VTHVKSFEQEREEDKSFSIKPKRTASTAMALEGQRGVTKAERTQGKMEAADF
jgi:hypothetical protein